MECVIANLWRVISVKIETLIQNFDEVGHLLYEVAHLMYEVGHLTYEVGYWGEPEWAPH